MTLGLIVGKFYPPHRGHKHLIESARRHVDRLVVLVAAHPSQTIAGQLRKTWLEEIHPDCDIRLVPDELQDDSQAWADFTFRYLGRAPDVVFSSEDYGPTYARLLGSRHVMIDRQRITVPTSGTVIRAAPLDHLHMLEPCVRAHFVRRVVLIGAESTGKTTLAQKLAERFDTRWLPEYGREHWERKLAARAAHSDPLSWTHEDFVDIAAEQQARENHAARSANRVLICDTNAFATGTWHERYYQSRDARVDAIGATDRADLYLLTAPDVPFVQDGVRDGEHIREWMHQRFLAQLQRGAAPWQIIRGAYAQRFETAERLVQDLIR